ncbi:MAG: hypothetical protein KC503_31030 [Myxococcales bacterium]|nr:hypothetical protein [Myxococcales bacterium]
MVSRVSSAMLLVCLAAAPLQAAPVDNTTARFSSGAWRGHSVSVSERGTLQIGDRFFASPHNPRFRTLQLSDGRRSVSLVGNDREYSLKFGRQNAHAVAAWFENGGHVGVAQAMYKLLDGNKPLAVYAELLGEHPTLIFKLGGKRTFGLQVKPREVNGRQQLVIRYGKLRADGPKHFVVLRNEPDPAKTARLAAPPQLRRNARKVKYLLGELTKQLASD